MIQPKKSLGQNFLKDLKVVQDLVNAANITKDDTVLEIGAGTGVITKKLAKQAGRVIAVEFDRDLIPTLQLNLKGLKNVEIISEDILELDVNRIYKRTLRHSERQRRISDGTQEILRPDKSGLRMTKLPRFKIIGSIPYQITSPLIHKLILEGGWSVAVLLIQKEVAKKITAQPPQAAYLSNLAQMFTKVELVRIVPKTAFWPQPKVDGAIIKMYRDTEIPKHRNTGHRPLRHPEPVSGSDRLDIAPKEWSGFLHRGFAHPRKMLNKSFPKDILEKAGIDPTKRPQELTIAEWVKIYRACFHQNI